MGSSNTYHSNLILAINPRIPFTNIGLFRNQQLVFLKKIMHSEDDRKRFAHYADQSGFRIEEIYADMVANHLPVEDIKVIISRCGLVKPVQAGVYRINEAMLKDLRTGVSGEDVVNLGGLIADGLSRKIRGSAAYVADPVVVDELDDLARVSGHAEFHRRSVFHALEQKAAARKYARTVQKKYEDLNLIVAQMGNGITVGAHCRGRVIDTNQGLDGDGPFSPARAGQVPMGDLVKLCFSGRFTQEQIINMLRNEGGLCSHLGVNDGYTADQMAIGGDEKAIFYLRAMAYQVAKTIGSMYCVLSGEVDAILLSGGMVHSAIFMDELQGRIARLAPVHTFPSEDDVDTLAANGYYILRGDITVQEYPA